MRRLIGGLVCGGAAVFAGATAMDDDTTRDDKGQIVQSGGLGVFRVEVGDCVRLPNEDESEVASVEGVPCDAPHDAQIYAEFDLADGAFPGREVLDEEAIDGCEARWEDALHTVWEDDPTYDFGWFVPTAGSWKMLGDRTVQCFVGRMDGDLIRADLVRP